MKLGIILNTSEPETAWNALRLGNEAMAGGHTVSIFLLGSGVEIETIKDKTYNVAELMKKFSRGKGSLLGCGTCMGIRHREAGVILKSTLSELLKLIEESDKIVSFG
ncbi:MAG: DsrE family protein [Dehalococcoidales bacterium]|nr:DsrE family protein [Dehalococcoidales bacterium]